MGEDGKQEDVPAQERHLEMLVNVDRCLSKLPMVEGSSGESVLLILIFLFSFMAYSVRSWRKGLA